MPGIAGGAMILGGRHQRAHVQVVAAHMPDRYLMPRWP
jgi:hypothetical protein